MVNTAGTGRKRRSVRSLVQILAFALVMHLFVIPQLGGAREAVDTIRDVSPLLIAAAVALEVASLLAYARLTQILLAVEHRPSLRVCFGVVLASMGINHVVPGGAATTAAINFRLYGLAGIPGPALAFALVTQAIGSAVVLNLILWIALMLSIPVSGFHAIYGTAAAVGATLLTLLGFIALGLLRNPDRLARSAGRIGKLVHFSTPEIIEREVVRTSAQLEDFLADRRRLAIATSLAGANWLLDAAALWVVMAAIGHRPNVVGLLVAYGLANVLAAIPVTPGGLGIVEAVLIPTLIAFGSPAADAAVGVVAFRLINFWLPIPTGITAYAIVERSLTHDHERVGVRAAIDDLVNTDHSNTNPANTNRPDRGSVP